MWQLKIAPSRRILPDGPCGRTADLTLEGVAGVVEESSGSNVVIVNLSVTPTGQRVPLELTHEGMETGDTVVADVVQ